MVQYDFDDFLSSMAKLDYDDIIKESETECISVEQGLSGKKGAVQRRKDGGDKYAAKIKNFLYFLRSGEKPGSASDVEFQKYKIVVNALIDKKQFNSTILSLFN